MCFVIGCFNVKFECIGTIVFILNPLTLGISSGWKSFSNSGGRGTPLFGPIDSNVVGCSLKYSAITLNKTLFVCNFD